MSLITCFLGPLIGQIFAGYWTACRERLNEAPLDFRYRAGSWQVARLGKMMDVASRSFGYLGIMCLIAGATGAIFSMFR